MLSPEGMTNFNEMRKVDGYHRLDDIVVNTATPTEQIIKNININVKRKLPAINDLDDWREHMPIAIVGGGPSLKKELKNLKKYKYILACGSVHDYLIEHSIIPTWCAICDPDPLMGTYLQAVNTDVKYLVASQCDPSIFNDLSYCNVNIWHLAGDKFDQNIYGEGEFSINGGCTIGTRAMCIAMGMGFYDLHLFGFDTCLNEKEHHAYDFNDPIKEKIYDQFDVAFEQNGPRFKVAGYHLGQLFDIKSLMRQYANRMQITVHGESLLSYFMDLAHKRLDEYTKQEALKKELSNG